MDPEKTFEHAFMGALGVGLGLIVAWVVFRILLKLWSFLSF